jgi:hypothetical protein
VVACQQVPELTRPTQADMSLTMTRTQTDADDVFDYQQRVVAFVDVLGFSKLVKASDTDLAARNKLRRMIDTGRFFERFMKTYLGFAEATFFSDTFIISMTPPDVRALYVIRETGYLCRHLLLQGFPCRGAITTGSLYHRGRFIVGPALADAYRLEQSVAIYPRVVLDDLTMKHWTHDLSPPHTDLESLVKRDRDGQQFLNLFSPAWQVFQQWHDYEPSPDAIPSDPIEFLAAAKKRIDEGCEANSDDLKVHAKYQWLASECRESTQIFT